MVNDFNYIAGVYDFLTRLVFGKTLLRAQSNYLNNLKVNDRILVLGGGSGEVLSIIQNLEMPVIIDYIEPSTEMIKRAKRKIGKDTLVTVHFHQIKFEEFRTETKYEWIHCAFFMDLFNLESLKRAIALIKGHMAESARLLVTDFQCDHNLIWQVFLSRIMHVFFRLFSNLESLHLKNINQIIQSGGFKNISTEEYYGKFIFSSQYEKIKTEK